MKPLLTSLAVLSVLGAPSVSAGVPVVPQDSGREAVHRLTEFLEPEIHRSLLAVLAAEEDFMRRVAPFDEQGQPISREKQEWRLSNPDSPLKQYLDLQRARFDTRGLEMDLQGLRDCILYDAAFGVAAELVADHPDLDPAEVVGAFDLAFVEAAPVWQSELSTEFDLRFRAGRELAPLGNGRALARLTWGLLQQEAWWREGERDRGQLILDLLGRGFQSRLLAEVVDLALAPPMQPSPDLRRDGRGVCAPHLTIAGKVGYDSRHEATLASDLELVAYLSRTPDPSGAMELDAFEIEVFPGGRVELTPNELGHLRYWVPRKLDQVRDELYDGAYREELEVAMRRSESLEARYLFWQDLATDSDFGSLRIQVLDELNRLMAWETDFPGTGRLRELRALEQVRELTDAEQSEWRELRVRAERDRDRFIGTLARYLVSSGAESNVDLLVSTLADDLTAALQPMASEGVTGAFRLERLLNDAWYRLAISDCPDLDRVLGQAIAGEEQGGLDLPVVARDNLIWAATANGGPEALLNLRQVIESGSPRDKGVALLNPEWADDSTYSHAMGELLEDAWSEDVDTGTRMRLEAYFSSSMAKRPVSEASREVLLASLRDEQWARNSVRCYWKQAWEDPEGFSERIDLVRRFLTDREVDQLIAEGVLPEGLF